jgi:hypothetical protein
MADQTARQLARRVALDAQARMRARRAEQERRRDALGVVVVAALAERGAVVSACEGRAGAALAKLTEQEGLSLAEAVEWCGGADLLTSREAARLRQGALRADVVGPARGAPTASTDAAADGTAADGAGSAGGAMPGECGSGGVLAAR